MRGYDEFVIRMFPYVPQAKEIVLNFNEEKNVSSIE